MQQKNKRVDPAQRNNDVVCRVVGVGGWVVTSHCSLPPFEAVTKRVSVKTLQCI